uniref:PAS domain-containing protein n=1 Tax=Pyramimonas obovata TaxID=1411642 RepID=A0A7S0RU02_9CHLO|mmetsp:Transcript_6348/g.12889  ORF Transcript_6348/g.12889 Transcript_6348/m.12889 type:complete len:591 (+) Transcript_6348:168-1940(+)|eukprot:CAMPEP_0118958788 /NCGR_PEP_ID=MMETSP1169-20130426/62802_1 /TAXON_ID=36882 /ORGANISM="Pyramimonas obovata, Strain CCMP722" /LENGTH=590 /DNA_ID=CAMNT_0006906915 /DNA_START=168 /DNA_END=1940 /DNA_ORIENTATION=+
MGCGQSTPEKAVTQSESQLTSTPTRLPEALEDVLEKSPYAMCASDVRCVDQPLVYVNDRLLDAYGYKRSDMLNYNCRFLQGPETDASTVRHIRQSIAEGKTFMGRLMNYTKEGTPLWNYLLLQPLRNADGVVTHYTSLSIMSVKDDYNTAQAAAKELSMLVDHIEDQGVTMVKPESCSVSASSSFKNQPKAPTRASFDTAHRGEGRRASVLMQDLRGKLDYTLSRNEVLLAILGSKEEIPVMYASQHLLGETFLRETELLGANLTFLLGKPTTPEEEAAYAEIVTKIGQGVSFKQERWLRTRHKVMQSLWGTLHFTPVTIRGINSYYVMVFNKSQEDRSGNLQETMDYEDMLRDVHTITRQMLEQSHDHLGAGAFPVSRVSIEVAAGEAAYSYSTGRGALRRTSIPLESIMDDEDLRRASQEKEKLRKVSEEATRMSQEGLQDSLRKVSKEDQHQPAAPPMRKSGSGKQSLLVRSISFSEMCATLDEEEDDTSRKGAPHKEPVLSPVAEEQRTETRGINARRRLSLNRQRRGASHTTLLPEKTQWIDMVLETMTRPDAPRWAVNESTLKALRDNLRANGPSIFEDHEALA